MAATHRHTGSNTSDVTPCPDPSAHEKGNKLSEQASTAALYVTHPERATESLTEIRSSNPLDPDGKLSSKSAATSLKYAKAHELPSFPSHGGSASAANSAAMLAKDYKMKELWQPEMSAAGSKAALQAHNKGGKLDLWQPSASADGNSAASMAMRNKGLSPQIFQGSTDDNKSKALLAATMSVSRNRERAGSTPAVVHPAYPDSHNSASNALNAATQSHRASAANKAAQDGWDSDAMQAARVQNLHMDRSMFGEHPPVEPEVEEARHNAALRASAITMAKQIMETKNREAATAADTAGQAGAEAAAARNTGNSSPDIKQEALRYINLQDAAHKLAAERLAKIDGNLENAKYREYYGYGNEDKSNRLSKRLSVLGRSGGRPRATSQGSDEELDSDDEREARKIRNQMSQLSSGLNKVDAAKQKDDRARLLAAAEKRVSAQMHTLDERVFLETGKIPPAMLEEWEEKSRKAAEEKKVERDAAKKGKTHIGGGKYMDQSEIEAIALARLRPTLDEIDRDAAEKRKRDEEERKEREQQEYYRAVEREKDRSQKEEFKQIQRNDKAAAKQEKAEIKAQKDEEKRAAKEEKRKSRVEAKDLAATGAAGAALGEVANKVKNDSNEEREDAKKRGGLFGSLRGRRNTREEQPKEAHETQDVAAASAAGATSGEVADKVKNDHEEPVETEDGPSKHFSALSRLKEKFMKDKEHDEVTGSETPAVTEPMAEPKSTGHTGAGLAAGAAAGATTGIAVADLEHEPKTAIQAPQQTESASVVQPESITAPRTTAAIPAEPSAQEFEAAQTSSNRDWIPVVPVVQGPTATEPTERLETIPASAVEPAALATLAAPEAVTIGSPVVTEDEADDLPVRNESVHDHIGAPGLLAARPDLERHISTIEDDDSDDLEDSDDGFDVGAGGLPGTTGAAALATQEAAQTSVQFNESDRVGATPNVEETTDNTGSAAVAAPLTLGSAGVPAVDTVPTPATEQHEPLSTLRDQRVQPTNTQAGPTVVGSGGSIAKDTAHPSTEASGPANEYVDRTSGDIRGGASMVDAETAEGEKKGLRGFFSKLKPGHKNKDKEDPGKLSDFKNTQKDKNAAQTSLTPVVGAAAVAGAGTGALIGSEERPLTAVQDSSAPTRDQSGLTTWAEPAPLRQSADHPISHAQVGSGVGSTTAASVPVATEPESPSSFTRDTAANRERDLDDVSSSGVDEEDVKHGRAGRLAAKLGFKSKKDQHVLHKKSLDEQRHASTTGTETEDEDQQFEEARDHFDESTAPTPVVEKPKPSTEGKGTKFTEDL